MRVPPPTSRTHIYNRLRFLIEFGIDLPWKKWYKRSCSCIDESVLERMQADAAPKTLKLRLSIAVTFVILGSGIVICD